MEDDRARWDECYALLRRDPAPGARQLYELLEEWRGSWLKDLDRTDEVDEAMQATAERVLQQLDTVRSNFRGFVFGIRRTLINQRRRQLAREEPVSWSDEPEDDEAVRR